MVSLLALAVGNFSPAADTATPSVAVLQAAQIGLPVFLDHIAPHKTTYGFLVSDDLQQAKLGQPIELFLLPAPALPGSASSKTSQPELSPAGAWFVPVQMGGESRGLIEVTLSGGQWKAASLGYAPLARKWARVQTWWPNQAGFTPRLVIAPSAGYFFSIPQIQPANLTALDGIADSSAAKPVTTPPVLMSLVAALARLQAIGLDKSSSAIANSPSPSGAQP